MKNFKRILAFVMVFCTVAAWMIPGVSAEAPASLTVDFQTAFTNASVANGTYLQSVSVANMDAAYGTSNSWNLYTVDGVFIRPNYLYAGGRYRENIYLELRTANSYSTTTVLPSVFVAPGTGDYKLSYVYGTPSKGDYKVFEMGAYILPMPETAYTKYNLPGPTSSSILTKAYKENPYNAEGYVNGSSKVSAEGLVALEGGKEYMLIFYGIGDGVKEAYADFISFSLDYVAKTDYSITYHANYEGAEVETVADNENVVGLYDTEKTFTVDRIDFNRPASFALRGWATTPDGEVAYQTGDEITLINSAPTLDLYAVWEEVWDPANNTDLTVNFVTDFTAAGVPSNGYLVTVANDNLLDAAYAAGTIKWTTVRDTQGNGMGYMATSNGGRFRAGKYLEVANGSYQANYPYAGVPLKFKAPGSGEYKLSFTYGKAAQAENGGTLIGAYITNMPESGTLTKYSNFNPAGSLLSAVVENPGGAGTGKSEGTVTLEGGEEYVIVFFAYDANATRAYGNFATFSLTEVKPEASIGSYTYKTVEMAIADAYAGDIITLNTDASMEELNLPANVSLNLNGKALAVSGAVAGTILDTTDGAGLLAASKEAVVTTPNGQIPLWDNTADAEGYRVFNYTFNSLDTTGTDNKQNLSINFVDAYKNVFDSTKTALLNGYTIYDGGNTINAAYEAGTINWGIAAGHRMGINNVDITSNGLKLGGRTLGESNPGRLGGVGLKIQSPGSGYYQPSISYVARPGDDVADNLYMFILPLPNDNYFDPDTNQMPGNTGYAMNSIFAATPSFDGVPATKILSTSIQDPEMEGTNLVRVAVGEAYCFEEGVEYMIILAVGDTNHASPTAEVLSMTFNCVQSETTFWSYMEFENDAAYTLVAASDLKAGFKVSTDGEYYKSFELDATTMAAWADAEMANAEEDYGFYVRVRGFESLKETTTVICVPYITSSGTTVDAEAKTFDYIIAE